MPNQPAGVLLLTLVLCVGCSDGGSGNPGPATGNGAPVTSVEPRDTSPTPQSTGKLPAVLELDGKRYPVSTGAAPGYVDDQACARCHQAIHDSYQSMGMARAFYPVRQKGIIEDLENNHYYHEPSDRHYEMHWQDDTYVMKRYRMDAEGQRYAEISQKVDWIIGSGNHARTYVYQTELGELYQLPLLWYSQGDGWGMAPGYDTEHHDGYNRLIKHECMFCHNGVASFPEGADRYAMPSIFPRELPHGLGCQRCHGPGAEHVWRATRPDSTLRDVHDSILNPSDLPRERQDEVCYQCHLQPLSTKKSIQRVAGRDIYSYRPGEPLAEYLVHVDFGPESERAERFEINHHPYRLRQSRCYTESGTMTCTTCHDPHRKIPPEERAAHYRKRCLQCHELADCDVDAMQASSPGGASTADCTACHMPEHRPEDVPLVIMTDHKIRRQPAPESWTAPRKQARHVPHERADIYSIGKTSGTVEHGDVYTSIALLQFGAHPRGIEMLEEAMAASGIEGPEAYLRLGMTQVRRGRFEDVLESYQKVLERTDLAIAHNNTGVALSELGRTGPARAAFERGIERFPDDPDLRLNLGLLFLRTGNMGKAKPQLEKAIALRPNMAMAHFALGEVFVQLGDLDAAVAQIQAAIADDPNMGKAYARLGGVLASRRDLPGALRNLRQGVRSAPDVPDVHVQLSWLALLQGMRNPGHLTEALRHGRRAVELDERNPVVQARLAMLLLMNRQREAAIEQVEVARKLGADPCSCDLMEAIALAQLGKQSEAQAAYDRAQDAASTPTTYRIRSMLQPFARKYFSQ